MKAVLIDPRIKLFAFLVSCVFVMSITRPVPLLCMGGFILLLMVLSGEVKSSLPLFMLFALSLIAANYFAGYIQGLPGALLMILCLLVRLIVPVAMAFSLVFKTTTVSQFMAAFQKMHVPAVIAIPFAVMFRFIPTLQEEWRGIQQAMAFRGIKAGFMQIVRHPAVSAERILVPLIFSAASIMDELAAASLARGLDSAHKRTCRIEIRMKWFDWLFFAVILLFCGVWLESLTGGVR